MLQTLRTEARLSRSELAQTLNVTPGYLLKAEQATFPSPPAPLIEYWANRLSGNSKETRDILKQAYYEQQRNTRRGWLNSWLPTLPGVVVAAGAASQTAQPPAVGPFSHYWRNRFTPTYTPSQYAVSKGLCVPASAVYFADKYPHKPVANSILAALNDLCEYATSGALHADMYFDEDVNMLAHDLLMIKEVLNGRTTAHTGVSA